MANFFKQMRQKPARKRSVAVWGLFLIMLVMSATVIAIMLLSKPSSENSLDIRQQAMTDSGIVELNSYPFNQSNLKINEKQNIQLQINSKTESLDAIELKFEIIADQGLLSAEGIQIEGKLPLGLELSKKEIVPSSCDKDCYLATLLLTSTDPNQPFSSHDQMETLQTLTFTAKKEGSLRLKISPDSRALSTNQKDVLDAPRVFDFHYYLTENGIDPAQCSFAYNNWGECQNNIQTRQFSVQPDNCQWYLSETLQELSRSCQSNDQQLIKADPSYFYLYTADRCWYNATDGNSIYILWNKEKYAGVTWIDLSSDPNFSDFYHKQVAGNIDQTQGDFLIVKANDFSHASTNDDRNFAFEPDQQYYFRLYTDQGKHISAARFYMNYCSGENKLYRSCNEQCGENTDNPQKTCAAGLTCHEGLCRANDNLEDDRCLPDLNDRSTAPSSRSCNDYCSDDSECSSALSCFWNRCRLPNNLESISCQYPQIQSKILSGTKIDQSRETTSQSTTASTIYQTRSIKNVLLPSEVYDLETYACNHGCNSNRDCDSNLRCYQGTCRLAANPENKSCSLIDTPSKGAAIIDTSSEASGSSEEVAPLMPIDDTSPTIQSSDDISPILLEEKDFFIKQSFLERFLSNFNWQWLALAGFFAILAMAFVVFGISRAKQDPWKDQKKKVDEAPSPFPPQAKSSTSVTASQVPVEQIGKIGYTKTLSSMESKERTADQASTPLPTPASPTPTKSAFSGKTETELNDGMAKQNPMTPPSKPLQIHPLKEEYKPETTQKNS